jgi:hypothetical protein
MNSQESVNIFMGIENIDYRLVITFIVTKMLDAFQQSKGSDDCLLYDQY